MVVSIKFIEPFTEMFALVNSLESFQALRQFTNFIIEFKSTSLAEFIKIKFAVTKKFRILKG